jgi:hypothetical protein
LILRFFHKLNYWWVWPASQLQLLFLWATLSIRVKAFAVISYPTCLVKFVLFGLSNWITAKRNPFCHG